MGQRPPALTPTDPLVKYLRDRHKLVAQGKAKNYFVPESNTEPQPEAAKIEQRRPELGLRKRGMSL